MKQTRKRKLALFGALAVSIFGVTVATLSTAAWFQINTTKRTVDDYSTVKSGSPNLTIDNPNVTGYKIQPTLGTDGLPYYGSSTVSSKKGVTVDVTNNNQDVADHNFDVPAEGLGYYLIRKNPGDTYKYKYNGTSTSWSWKFAELDNSSVNYMKVASVTTNEDDSFIIREYSYNKSEYKTVNKKVAITKDIGDFDINSTTYEITPTEEDSTTYNIWFNKSTNKVSFEKVESISSKNRSLRYKNSKRQSNDFLSSNLEVQSRNNSINANPSTDKRFTILFNSSSFYPTDNAVIRATLTGGTWNNDSTTGTTIIGKDNDLSVDSTWDKFNSVKIDNVTYRAVTSIVSDVTWENITILRCSSDSASTAWNHLTVTGPFNGSSNNTVMINASSVGSAYGNYFKSTLHTGLGGNTVSYNLVYANNYNPGTPASISGYTFKGWYKDSSCSPSSSYSTQTLTGDIELYAKYEKNGGDTTSTYNIKLFLNGNTDWGTTVYCYAYGGSGTYDSYSNVFVPADYTYSASRTTGSYTNGETGSSSSYYYYSFTISSSFPNVIFCKNSSFSDDPYYIDQTVDLADANTHSNDYFVITGPSSIYDTHSTAKWDGSWYASISGVSSTMKDYYIYDQAEYLNEDGTPYVYAWVNNVTGDGTNTFYMPHNSANAVERSAWPGVALLNTDADGTTPLPSHMYRFRISQTYDSFILSNGKDKGASGAFQTQDLTGGSGLSGHGMTSGSARTASTYYFVFSGKQGKDSSGNNTNVAGDISYYEVSGSWIQNIGTLSLKVAFAIYDGSNYKFLNTLSCGIATNGTWTIKNDFYVNTVPYKPTITAKSGINSGNDFVIADSDNGIVYNFAIPSGTLTWYKDTTNWTTFNSADGETGYTGDLYVRAVCDIRDYVTIYVDDSAWSNENLAVKTSGGDSTYFTSDGTENWKIATGLYRLTLRNDWIIQLSSGSHTGYSLSSIGTNPNTGVPNMGSGSYIYYRTHGGVTYDYLRISSSGEGSSWGWVDYKPISNSGVWVQKYSGGSWNNVTNGELLFGDGDGNDYIFESGLELTNGDIIRVCDTKNTGDTSDDVVYGYSKYFSDNKPKHTYVAGHTVSGESTNTSIEISRLGGVSVTARFNFYITHSGYISIAMVPDYGNGYYIMEYNETDKTENFIGAIKMDSSDYSASYDGYYCRDTNVKIFIRSYLNAVDNICTSLTSTTSPSTATMKTSSGDDQYCITFGAVNHYNIRVTNQIVDITPYQASDFFSLNKLESSLVTAKATNAEKQQEIWRQQTAIVLEVPFTANNPFNSNIKLKVVGGTSYIGVRFAVYKSKQNDPYDLMRGNTNTNYGHVNGSSIPDYLTDSSTSAAINDVNSTTIDARTSTQCYAYILIDYRYIVTYSNLTGSNPEMSFYLQIVQS